MPLVWETDSPVVSPGRSERRGGHAHTHNRSRRQISTNYAEPAKSAAGANPEVREGKLEFAQGRIGKPVRIGAVMFRLLKRYGITDEEIAEGIAKYVAEANQ